MVDIAAQAAAQQVANRRLTETILDLPKFYGSSKDTVTAENLIDCIDASVNALAWTLTMANDYFHMALHSNAEAWQNRQRISAHMGFYQTPIQNQIW
jgi:hypothetical protein